MKLDDFLKCKKVRCVKGYGRHLTSGKTYPVLGLSVPNNLVKVENDNGFITEYDFGRFEPVIDQVENPLQNMKLTPEFEAEASEPRFKVGDKVYYRADEEIFVISDVSDFGDVQIKYWREDYHNSKYFCHATQENYEMLCNLYPHIEFERPPKPLVGSDLARAMLERGDRRIYGYASDNSDNDPHGYECVVRDYDVNSGFGVIMSNARYEFFNPCDPRTGEPLTEAVLDE